MKNDTNNTSDDTYYNTWIELLNKTELGLEIKNNILASVEECESKEGKDGVTKDFLDEYKDELDNLTFDGFKKMRGKIGKHIEILSYKLKKKREKPNKENILQKSFIKIKDKIYEQIIGNEYVYWGGEFKFTSSIEDRGLTYIPCCGAELEEGQETVLLAQAPLEYESIPDLVIELKEFIHEWLDVSEEFKTFASWYVLLTWVYDALPTINYLSVMGDTGVGKSRFLDVIGRLCYKATLGSGGVTVAAVKRLTNKWKGTMLIDEGDFKESDETAELIKFFNLGFEKNRKMFNCDKNDPSKLEFFDPYCPKIITRRRQFRDHALEARCITEVMKQTVRKEIPALLTKGFYKKQTELRNKLLKFRFDNYDKIDIDKSLEIDLGDIEPRIRQATLAFTTLFANFPETLANFKEFLRNYNNQVIEERATSFDGAIINIIINKVIEGEKHITPKDIELVLKEDGYTKLTAATIGKHLTQLKIGTKAKKIEGKTKKTVPIETEVFRNVVKRYCSDQEKVTAVTEVTAYTGTSSLSPKSPKTPINNNNNIHHLLETAVTGVTFHKCGSCGNTPCLTFTSSGKPICKDCYDVLKLNNIPVENIEE